MLASVESGVDADLRPEQRGRPSSSYGLQSAFPACEEVDQEMIDLLRLLFMRKMPAFWNGVRNEIACHLRPNTGHIKDLAD